MGVAVCFVPPGDPAKVLSMAKNISFFHEKNVRVTGIFLNYYCNSTKLSLFYSIFNINITIYIHFVIFDKHFLSDNNKYLLKITFKYLYFQVAYGCLKVHFFHCVLKNMDTPVC